MKNLKLIIAMGFFLSAGLLKAQSSQDPSLVAPQKAYHWDAQPAANTVAVNKNTATQSNAPRGANAQPRLAPKPQPKPAQVVRADQSPNGQHQAATVKPADSK